TEHFWQVRSLARAGTIADPQFVLLLSVLGENEYVASIARMGDEIYFTSAALAGTSITEKPTLYRYDSTRPDAQPEPVHLRQELVDAPTDLRRLDAVQKAFPFRDALLLEAEGSGGDRPVYLYDGTRAVFAFFMPGGIRAVQPFGGRLYLLAGASTKIYVYDGITLSVAREQLTFPGIADGQDRMEVSRSDSGTSGEVIGSPTAFAAHNGKLFISFIVGGETWLVRNGKSVGRMENFSGIATYDGASWDVPASYNWSGRRPRFIEPNSGRGIGIAGLASVGGTLYAGGRGYVLDVSTGFQPVEKAMLFAEQSGTFISADDPAFDTQGLAIRKLTAFGNILLVAMAQGGGNALYVYEPAESRLNSLMGNIGPEILFAIKDGSLFIPIADWNGASAALARFDLFALSDWSDTASFTTPRTCARGLFRIFDFFREI
ncbi:MAG: hypothetical protein HYU35_02760, partial [Parcubacteria group bacterium]|nr:hypothetical protein [Parcubacteria group bacterium]